MTRYGLDEYSRYMSKDGELLAVEPFPGKWIVGRILFRLYIIRWHLSRLTGIKWEG